MVSCLQKLFFFKGWRRAIRIGRQDILPQPLSHSDGEERKVASGGHPILTHSFGHQSPHFYVLLYILQTARLGHETIHSFRKCRNICEFSEKAQHSHGFSLK